MLCEPVNLPCDPITVDSRAMRSSRSHPWAPSSLGASLTTNIASWMMVCSLVVGCGGTQEPRTPRVFAEDQYRDNPEKAPIETVDMPLTRLSRSRVNQAVDEGLGRFLQELTVESSLHDGRFQGFRIVGFRDPEAWQGTGLMPGDVILAINDMPIERPEQAYAAFASLKTADRLEVTYLRAGTEMRLSLPIVETSTGGEESAEDQTKTGGEQKPGEEQKPASEDQEEPAREKKNPGGAEDPSIRTGGTAKPPATEKGNESDAP